MKRIFPRMARVRTTAELLRMLSPLSAAAP